jgi:hypothetical protein
MAFAAAVAEDASTPEIATITRSMAARPPTGRFDAAGAELRVNERDGM